MTAQPIEKTPTSTDLVDPRGKIWHRSEKRRLNGEALYYIDGAPATCPAHVMSTEAELAGLFGAPMRAVDGAA